MVKLYNLIKSEEFTQDMSEQFKLDFVGIGAGKSGTTWLAACLEDHPEICLSRKKELFYFMREGSLGMSGSYDLGESWLRSHFRHCQTGQIKGEYSVWYYDNSESPELIKAHNPDIKLIAAFRNPVERLQSLYYELLRQYQVPSTFAQFVEEDREFLPTGLYARGIHRFLQYFPRQNIHIIIFDDIVANPRSVLRDLYTFLDVSPDFRPPSLQERINARKEVRWPFLRDVLSAATYTLNHTPRLRWLLLLQRRLKLNRIRDWLSLANTRPSNSAYQPMPEKTRKFLRDYYAESNIRLGKLLGIDLSHWNE
jgi:hypothetical protein